jgi:threonylcarbamoyladenosine tRNA methylthiotransferase MtaB
MDSVKSETKYATAITIGCRLNQTDTAIIFAELKKAGFEIEKSDTDKKLSLIIINTCAVTSSASQKSRQYTRALKEKYPDAKIIVTGCDVEVDREKWLTETSADILIPNTDKTNILKYIKVLFPILHQEDKKTDYSDGNFSFGSIGYFPFKSRANIKIQDGCDAYCTYCIVPYGRGKPRSREWDNTLKEFKELLQKGYKEIILTGVNIATYNDNGRNLIALCNKMCSFEGEYRIRLGSTEPQFDMQELIELIASNNKLCRFLHLPLQHGSDNILQKMGRSYKRKSFANFIRNAMGKVPEICIGTDIITGFPGETDNDFNDSLKFISSLPVSYLHVFKYSRRKGTPASNYPAQVHPKISEERHQILSELGEKLSKKFMESQKGKTASVILERYYIWME